MIDNERKTTGSTMVKPETVDAAITAAGAKHGYSLRARGLR
jgi:hypothetical protein